MACTALRVHVIILDNAATEPLVLGTGVVVAFLHTFPLLPSLPGLAA